MIKQSKLRKTIEASETAENEKTHMSNSTKKKDRRGIKYDDATISKVVLAYNNGRSVRALSEEYGIHTLTIYKWLNGKVRGRKNANAEANAAFVEKVIKDINNSEDTAHSNSLAVDFGIGLDESNNSTSKVELNFCPCCGTNIKAVRIALETCQELAG